MGIGRPDRECAEICLSVEWPQAQQRHQRYRARADCHDCTAVIAQSVKSAIGGIPVPAIVNFSLQLKDIWNRMQAIMHSSVWWQSGIGSGSRRSGTDGECRSAADGSVFVLWQCEHRRATSSNVHVSGDNPGTDPLEYRYRVNGGYWTVWKVRDAIALSHLPSGHNVVDVCSKAICLGKAAHRWK